MIESAVVSKGDLVDELAALWHRKSDLIDELNVVWRLKWCGA